MRGQQSQEEYLLLTVRALAQDNGWITYHTLDSRGSEKGWPDLALARAPQLMFVELKSSEGRITKEQQRWIDELTACGVDARLVRYGTLEMAALFADLRKPSAGSAEVSIVMKARDEASAVLANLANGLGTPARVL